MPGRPLHLARRFFEVLLARPLDASESSTVTAWIGPELYELFVSQQTADQRHGYATGRRVHDRGVTDPDVIAAGVLHDVGKRHSGLGAMGRTLATLLMVTGLPMPQRMARYRDHGAIGADDLEEAGAPGIVVQFARHHQGERPESIPKDTWEILHTADLAAKPRCGTGRGISSTAG